MNPAQAHWCIGGPLHLTRRPSQQDYFYAQPHSLAPVTFPLDAPFDTESRIKPYLYQAKQWAENRITREGSVRRRRWFCFVGEDYDITAEESFIGRLLTVREGPAALVARAQKTEAKLPPWICDGRRPLSIRIEVGWSYFLDCLVECAIRHGLA